MADSSTEKNIFMINDEEQEKDKLKRERSEEEKFETSKRVKKDETRVKETSKGAIAVCGSCRNEGKSSVKYMECQKNQSLHLVGVHSVDGCGEFMTSQSDKMYCEDCGCHRSFHIREECDCVL